MQHWNWHAAPPLPQSGHSRLAPTGGHPLPALLPTLSAEHPCCKSRMIANNPRDVSNTRGCSILPIIPSAVPKRGRHDLLAPGCQRRRGLRMASSHRPVLSLIRKPTALLDISGFACGGGIDHRGSVRSRDRLNGLTRHPAPAGQRHSPHRRGGALGAPNRLRVPFAGSLDMPWVRGRRALGW